MIKSESGHKLSATFKSGVYDDWKKKSRTYMPKVGEAELAGRATTGNEKKWRHQGQKTKMDEGEKGKGKRRRIGKPGSSGSAPGGLKSAADIRKDRISKEKRVKRSNQPSKKNPNGYKGSSGGDRGGGGGGGGGGGRRK